MMHFSLFVWIVCLFIPRVALANDHLNAQIISAIIPPDRRPVVTLKVTNVKNKPLELTELDA